MKFGEAVAANPAPGKTLVLEPWVFADEWPRKPGAAVCVGLRLIPDKEKTKARFTAEELADEVHPKRDHNWVDAFNDALMRQVVALALCDPNNVRRPFELMPLAESDVSDAFTSKGVHFVFRELDQYEIASSCIGIPADHVELQRLAVLLPRVEPSQLSTGLRRLITHVVEELDKVFGEDEDDLVDAVSVDDASDERPIFIGVNQPHVSDPLGPR